MTSKDEVLSMFALDMHFTIQFLRINGFRTNLCNFMFRMIMMCNSQLETMSNEGENYAAG